MWTPSHPGDSNVHRASLADRSVGFLWTTASSVLLLVAPCAPGWPAAAKSEKQRSHARRSPAHPDALCASARMRHLKIIAFTLSPASWTASVVAQWQICRGISWTTLGPQSAALWAGAKVLWARAPAQTTAGDHGDSNTTGSSSSSFRHRRDNRPMGRSSCRRTGSGRTCGGCR